MKGYEMIEVKRFAFYQLDKEEKYLEAKYAQGYRLVNIAQSHYEFEPSQSRRVNVLIEFYNLKNDFEISKYPDYTILHQEQGEKGYWFYLISETNFEKRYHSQALYYLLNNSLNRLVNFSLVILIALVGFSGYWFINQQNGVNLVFLFICISAFITAYITKNKVKRLVSKYEVAQNDEIIE